MKYVIQIDCSLKNLVTDEGRKVDGVILTRKMECSLDDFSNKLATIISDIQSSDRIDNILDMNIEATESCESLEEGRVYY
jgi:hypothetical protein